MHHKSNLAFSSAFVMSWLTVRHRRSISAGSNPRLPVYLFCRSTSDSRPANCSFSHQGWVGLVGMVKSWKVVNGTALNILTLWLRLGLAGRSVLFWCHSFCLKFDFKLTLIPLIWILANLTSQRRPNIKYLQICNNHFLVQFVLLFNTQSFLNLQYYYHH